MGIQKRKASKEAYNGKGADDMRKTKRQQVEQKLSVVRRTSYTFFAFALFELSGVFALAGIKGLYVVTETASNAFSPKKYVDVDINEPYGNEYVIKNNQAAILDADGNIALDGTNNNRKKTKIVSVQNAFGSKKDVVLRSKIVAEIYDGQNKVYHESLTTDDYMISVGSDTDYTDNKDAKQWLLHTDGYYYYTSILQVGEETTNLFDNVTITDTGLSKIPEDGYVKFNVIIDSLDAGVSSGTVADCWGWSGSNKPQLKWN